MACLSTSGRLACGSRRQQAHKFIWRLFLDNSLKRQSSNLAATSTSTSTLQGHTTKQFTQNQQLARSFHGLNFGAGQDYLSLLVSKETMTSTSTATAPPTTTGSRGAVSGRDRDRVAVSGSHNSWSTC